MEDQIHYLYQVLLLFVLEKLYLYLAQYLKIETVPNSRSAHSKPTIVGGGIIVPIACIVYLFSSRFNYPFWIIAMFGMAVVCFIDDIKEVSAWLRILTQATATAILFFQFDVYSYPVLIVALIGAIMIVSLNAYNFLDGINGMTSANSLVQLGCLYFINKYSIHFIDGNLLIMVIMAVLVFSYFNFRVSAVCFAGDVGSISLAFFVCGCILKLILVSKNLIFINLLLVYYLDAVTTFVFRWLQGHNVFKAHNKHFYLYLVNHCKWPHLAVACLYAGVQLISFLAILFLFNGTDINLNHYNFYYTVLVMTVAGALVVWLRIYLEGSSILKKASLNATDYNHSNKSNHILQ